MSEDAIALAIGVSTTTLRKHFEGELNVGAAQRRLEAYDALFAQVKRGNVAAIKAAMLLVGASMPASQPDKPDETPAPAPTRLGKKEAANLAAKGAADGTDWAGLLPGSTAVQ